MSTFYTKITSGEVVRLNMITKHFLDRMNIVTVNALEGDLIPLPS